MKYLGANAPRPLAYGVASVSGTILAVCSCTVLPLFAGIWRMGAGLGPATAFLYSGPAINVLAIVLTARILGVELGVARAVGAVVFAVVIGLLMHLIYRREEQNRAAGQMAAPEPAVARPLWQNALYFGAMVAVLVLANWGSPREYDFELRDGRRLRGVIVRETVMAASPPQPAVVVKIEAGATDRAEELTLALSAIVRQAPVPGVFSLVWQWKWVLTAAAAAALGVMLVLWMGFPWWGVAITGLAVAALAVALPHEPLAAFAAGAAGVALLAARASEESRQWLAATWTFAKQILPLLLGGVLVAGLLLGRPEGEGLISGSWVQRAVGGNSLAANVLASVVGAFMYFATLTEVPILQGLIGAGMGKGPALALLLAGPALSLPSMLVLRSIMGTGKTAVYVTLVVVLSTVTGVLYGALF